jgi:hypothetical protein
MKCLLSILVVVVKVGVLFIQTDHFLEGIVRVQVFVLTVLVKSIRIFVH